MVGFQIPAPSDIIRIAARAQDDDFCAVFDKATITAPGGL